MTLRPKVVGVEFEDDYFYFVLSDGRKIGQPIKFYKKLLAASHEERMEFIINEEGVHWGKIDEDISVEPLLSIFQL